MKNRKVTTLIPPILYVLIVVQLVMLAYTVIAIILLNRKLDAVAANCSVVLEILNNHKVTLTNESLLFLESKRPLR